MGAITKVVVKKKETKHGRPLFMPEGEAHGSAHCSTLWRPRSSLSSVP